jgi:hypothetical protein
MKAYRWLTLVAAALITGFAALVLGGASSTAHAADAENHAPYVTALPKDHTTIMYGGMRYYAVNHTYYRWDSERKRYEIVAPPPGYESAITGQPAADGELYVYARDDVSPDQQLNDRYECGNYASEQSGYDPTKEDGGVPADMERAKQADYFRAEAACLEGRGYRVR